MEEGYVFNQSENELWGDNKLPVSRLNIVDMFETMNKDLFEALEKPPSFEEILMNTTDENLFRQLEIEVVDMTWMGSASTPDKLLVMDKCSSCNDFALYILPHYNAKTLRGIKVLACAEHKMFDMVPMDSWLCKAPAHSESKSRCRSKALCRISGKQFNKYCPGHARLFWLGRNYIQDRR